MESPKGTQGFCMFLYKHNSLPNAFLALVFTSNSVVIRSIEQYMYSAYNPITCDLVTRLVELEAEE